MKTQAKIEKRMNRKEYFVCFVCFGEKYIFAFISIKGIL